MQGFRHSSNTLTFVLPDAPHMTGPTCLDACTLDSLRIFHLFHPSSAQVEVIPKRRLIITSPKGQVEDSPRPLPRRTATTDQWEVEGEQRRGNDLAFLFHHLHPCWESEHAGGSRGSRLAACGSLLRSPYGRLTLVSLFSIFLFLFSWKFGMLRLLFLANWGFWEIVTWPSCLETFRWVESSLI